MKIVEKRGWFWVGLHWLVVVVTFGRNRRFLTDYLTTIGPIVGVPVSDALATVGGAAAVGVACTIGVHRTLCAWHTCNRTDWYTDAYRLVRIPNSLEALRNTSDLRPNGRRSAYRTVRYLLARRSDSMYLHLA